MDAGAVLNDLSDALEECRFRDVRTLVAELQPEQFDASQAARVLKLLRKKRLFEELATAADVLMEEHNEPVLRRLVAQALIDQGNVDQALARLRRLAPKVEEDPDEGPEVRGLIGRALKQRFVEEGDTKALTEAITAYEIDGRLAPATHRWHGINLVACIMRARDDGVDIGSETDPVALAKDMLDTLSRTKDGPVWDLATGLESAVALGEKDEALRWLTRYVKHPDADAFELGSTVRQLKEIWQLDGSHPIGGAILPVMEYELIRRTGGTLGATTETTDTGGFEAVFGTEASKPLQWLDTLRKRCESIARVASEAEGRPYGTGFLTDGAWLSSEWEGDVVFVTNSHVVSMSDQHALRPEDTIVEFTRLDGRPKVKLGELLFESEKEQLDVSVLRIEPPTGGTPLALTEYSPIASDTDSAAQVYVAGHPAGRDLEVTLYDNQLREVTAPFARYRSPTEGGNSGSPVMNGKWKVFALHHRAVEEKQLNEGVLFDSIRTGIGGG